VLAYMQVSCHESTPLQDFEREGQRSAAGVLCMSSPCMLLEVHLPVRIITPLFETCQMCSQQLAV
jgi:hypothetical protein